MLGFTIDSYKSEKSLIGKSLEKIDEFKRDCTYFNIELKEREEAAEQQLAELPILMSGIFDKLETLVEEQNQKFS